MWSLPLYGIKHLTCRRNLKETFSSKCQKQMTFAIRTNMQRDKKCSRTWNNHLDIFSLKSGVHCYSFNSRQLTMKMPFLIIATSCGIGCLETLWLDLEMNRSWQTSKKLSKMIQYSINMLTLATASRSWAPYKPLQTNTAFILSSSAFRKAAQYWMYNISEKWVHPSHSSILLYIFSKYDRSDQPITGLLYLSFI